MQILTYLISVHFDGLYTRLKGRVSIREFLWYLNVPIIFWEEVITYRGHASLKNLNRMRLWFCVYYVLKWAGYLYNSPARGNKLAIYNLTIIETSKSFGIYCIVCEDIFQ